MRRLWPWLAGAAALAVVIALVVPRVANEPLRARIERNMNRQLKGYTVSIGSAHFHPAGLGIELRDLRVVQQANPDPPVAYVPRLTASVQWWALLHARLVADMKINRPVAYVNRRQTQHEAASRVPVKERGWQEAVEQIYPLEINELRIVDGELAYVDRAPFPPLRLSSLQLVARNIRNVRSQARTYPSEVHLDAVLLDSARLRVDGDADFLAEPHVGIKARVDVDDVALSYLEPIVRRRNVSIRRGTASAHGTLEYAPTIEMADLEQIRIDGLDAEYIHEKATAPAERARLARAGETAKKTANQPGLFLRAARVEINRSMLAYTDRTKDHPYRVFIDDEHTLFTNVTNHGVLGTAQGKVTGKLMGSGDTLVVSTLHPETNGADFALALRMKNTDLRALNDVWRAYGKFDVAEGTLSVYSQVRVKNGMVNGYVKPLFRHVKVYDPEQERGKGLGQKVYEGLVGAVGSILENQPRKQIATRTDLSGPLENPRASTWQVLVNLVRNAFFESILPGLEGRPATPGEARGR